jgi:hypothetical protein
MSAQSEAQKEIVRKMLDRFREASIGDLVPHNELIRLNHGSSRTHYWAASRAMRLLNGENGAVFATVRSEGYRRLDTPDGAEYAGEKARIRIHAVSHRGYKQLENVSKRSNDITPDQQGKINQHLSTFGLIGHLTNKRTIEIMPKEAPPQYDDFAGLRQALGRP